jgi:hypothetical protein
MKDSPSKWHLGRAMAEAASRWPLSAEARVRARASPCGICGEQSDIGTGLCTSSSVFPCQYHFTVALHIMYHVGDEQ